MRQLGTKTAAGILWIDLRRGRLRHRRNFYGHARMRVYWSPNCGSAAISRVRYTRILRYILIEVRQTVAMMNRQRYAVWKAKRGRYRGLVGVAPKPPAVVPATVNVAAIRKGLGGWPAVTQAAFAGRFGFSAAAVRDWEQGRRKPDAAACVLLLVIAHNADAVDAAIQAASTPGTPSS